VWTGALLLFATLVLGTESAWRRLGYCPGVLDSLPLWKYWYERGVRGGSQTIMIIGTSRIQAGISTRAMREELPNFTIAQLAVYASGSPIAVLAALANDDRFQGTVLVDTIEPFLFRRFWNDQRAQAECNSGPLEYSEAWMSAEVRDHLAIRTAETGIKAVFKHFVTTGAILVPLKIRMCADRSLEFDYEGLPGLEKFKNEKLQLATMQYEESIPATLEEFDAAIDVVEGYVRAIRTRGGHVVFLRMPSSGGRRELEDKYHPKDKYWHRLVAATTGVCIHSDDLPGLRGVACPDDSHLDYRDAITLTHALIEELLRRNVIQKERLMR
jgi:hypothetical protein